MQLLRKTCNIADLASSFVKIVYARVGGLLLLWFVMATTANTEQNILGKIPNIYWTASPITRYGLYEENGNTYLAIPSGWVGRKFHIKNFFSVLFGEQQSNERQIVELNRIDRLSRNMNCIIKIDERK